MKTPSSATFAAPNGCGPTYAVLALAPGEHGAPDFAPLWSVQREGLVVHTSPDRQRCLGEAARRSKNEARRAAVAIGLPRRSEAHFAAAQAPSRAPHLVPAEVREGESYRPLDTRRRKMLEAGTDPGGVYELSDDEGAARFGQALVASMRARGWATSDVYAAFEHPSHVGAASLTRRWRGMSMRGARSDWKKRVARSIVSADAELDRRAAADVAPGSGGITGMAGAIEAHIASHPGGGQGGVIDDVVMLAVLDICRRAQRSAVFLPVRTMLEATGIGSHNTLRKSLARLVESQRLELVSTAGAKRGLGHLYRPLMPAQVSNGADPEPASEIGATPRCTSHIVAHAGNDAYAHGALGRTGLVIVAALVAAPGTTTELAKRSGCAVPTVRRHMARLVALGLAAYEVVAGARVHRSTAPTASARTAASAAPRSAREGLQGDLDAALVAVATTFGTVGRAQRRRERHGREREAWLNTVTKRGVAVAEMVLGRPLGEFERVDLLEGAVVDSRTGEAIPITGRGATGPRGALFALGQQRAAQTGGLSLVA